MKKLFLAFIFLFLFTTSVWAESVSLEWDANSESDLAGYKMYWGNSSGVYDNSVDVGNQTSYTIVNLAVSTTYYIAATAYDTSGNESGYSDEISQLILDVTPPNVPTNIRIIIITQ